MKLLPLIFLVPSLAFGDTLNLSWVAPTEREDGTVLAGTEIAGYRLVWSVRGTVQPERFVSGNVTSYVLDTGSLSGRTCIRLATRDTGGLESVLTSEVCRNSKPNPPGNPGVR